MRVCTLIVFGALVGASQASAQSLADVARKEGERRQEVTPATRTYTNTDLRPTRNSNADAAPADDVNRGDAAGNTTGGDAVADERQADGSASPSSEPAAQIDGAERADAAEPNASEPGTTGSDASDADATTADAAADAGADENAGSRNANSEQYWAGRMSRLREQLERNQTYLNALQSRVNALTTDFVNRDDPAQRTQISNERQKALAEIERLEKQIQADRQAIPELEDEARRAGVPAGWLR